MKKINKNKKQQPFVFRWTKRMEYSKYTLPQSFCNSYREQGDTMFTWRSIWVDFWASKIRYGSWSMQSMKHIADSSNQILSHKLLKTTAFLSRLQPVQRKWLRSWNAPKKLSYDGLKLYHVWPTQSFEVCRKSRKSKVQKSCKLRKKLLTKNKILLIIVFQVFFQEEKDLSELKTGPDNTKNRVCHIEPARRVVCALNWF